MLDSAKLGRFVDQVWGDAIVPTLVDYIRIPNKSPAFDPDWVAHGHMEEAVAMFERWARERLVVLPGATLEVVRLPERRRPRRDPGPRSDRSPGANVETRCRARGSPASTATSFMAAAAPMTDMRCSLP